MADLGVWTNAMAYVSTYGGLKTYGARMTADGAGTDAMTSAVAVINPTGFDSLFGVVGASDKDSTVQFTVILQGKVPVTSSANVWVDVMELCSAEAYPEGTISKVLVLDEHPYVSYRAKIVSDAGTAITADNIISIGLVARKKRPQSRR